MANVADRRGQSRGSSVRKLISARAIVGLGALVLAVVFIVENNQKVRIHFVFFTAHSRLWVGFIVSLVLGALLGQVFFLFRRNRNRSPAQQASKDQVTRGRARR